MLEEIISERVDIAFYINECTFDQIYQNIHFGLSSFVSGNFRADIVVGQHVECRFAYALLNT